MRPLGLITALLLGFCSEASAAIYTVINTNDSGSGSLRQALTDALSNHSSGVETIQFNLPGSPPYTIMPSNDLPVIAVPMLIDGTSQPGYSGRPLVEVAGNKAGANVSGLVLEVGGSTVQGLAINRFGGYGIFIEGDGADTIQGNFIGTDVTGTTNLPNGQAAVGIFDCPDNVIGGLSAGTRNLLSGRNRSGIYITGNNAARNLVAGNLIGTDATGLLALGSMFNGILISEAPSNVIGGTVAAARNIISANNQSGIYITGAGAFSNVVQGNFIGVDVSGSRSLSNASDGVTIYSASSNLIGGAIAGARNVISGNGHYGIYIGGSNSTANLVQGNFLGTDAAGTNALKNRFSGVGVENVSGNLIGGTTAAARNLISGNGQSGLRIYNGAANNLVQGNFIGTDITGTRVLSNAYDGVTIELAHANRIGGVGAGAGNLISGNALFGIYITNTTLPGNLLQGNFIGTDASGQTALPNGESGVGIFKAPGNTIGGTDAGAGNLISENYHGLLLENSAGNIIQGNFIGTDVSGTMALGNLSVGLFLSDSQSNLVGGPAPGARNLFANNFDDAFYLTNSSGNAIQGNFIGTDWAGLNLLPNGEGIFIDGSSSNLVGGSNVGEGNLISGNIYSGVYISGTATRSNLIQGNFIGTDRTGFNLLPNSSEGVDFEGSSSNLVGGSSLGAGNLISGNGDSAVYISGANARANIVQGNFIGTAPDGVTRLENQQHGVQILNGSSLNLIGGPGPTDGNVIAYNTSAGYDGVRVQTAPNISTNNLIAGNSIFGISGAVDSLGIDLGTDGVTPNDSSDNDGGANNLQNFPVLTLASNSPGQTVIQGTLNTIGNKSYRLEFFASPACNASGDGDGKAFLGALTVTTPSNGNVAFTNTIPWAIPAGYFVSATATDPANNTSEFSACRAVVGSSISADLRVTSSVTPNPAPLGGNLTWQITIQNLGPNPAYGLKLTEVLPTGASFISASPTPVFRFGNTLTFKLGSLANGASLVISIVVSPTVIAPLTNLVSVTSDVPDPITANNSATNTVGVSGPHLIIERAADILAVSWPAALLDSFQLESADEVVPTSWNAVTNTPSPNGDLQTVNQGISAAQRFYRLRKR